MKFLFDFFPVIVFFAAYKLTGGDMMAATGAIIAATGLQVALSWMQHRRVEKMHLITLALVVVFGGATILLGDEQYIKWKVSVVNWLFAAVFLGSEFVGDKNIVRRMMESSITVENGVWRRLNLSWAAFFLTMGFINLYVMFHYGNDIWVNFKLYGLLGLTLLFVIAQALYLTRHVKDHPQREEDTP